MWTRSSPGSYQWKKCNVHGGVSRGVDNDQALFKEKLVVEDTKPMTEQSGLSAFLMMPQTCASFLQHFEHVPTQKECHRHIMEASHRDDTGSSRLIGLRVEDRINCTGFFNRIDEIRKTAEERDTDKVGAGKKERKRKTPSRIKTDVER